MLANRCITLISSIILLVAFSGNAQGQTVTSSTGATTGYIRPIVPKKPKPLRRELSGGYRQNSDGWSIYVDKGYVRSDEGKLSDQFFNLRMVQVEFGEHRDPRQRKKKFQDMAGDQTKPFVYGKVNNFYNLKLGYGIRKMIAGKPEPGTVSVHLIGNGGFALGLEKPYYLEAYEPQDGGVGPLVQQSIKYSEENNDYFLNDYYIIGGSGFTKGLNEIKFVPGIYARTGLHFDFAANKKTVLALETGISAELYSRKVQLMAREEGKQYFISVFAAIQFGKRW